MLYGDALVDIFLLHNSLPRATHYSYSDLSSVNYSHMIEIIKILHELPAPLVPTGRHRTGLKVFDMNIIFRKYDTGTNTGNIEYYIRIQYSTVVI